METQKKAESRKDFISNIGIGFGLVWFVVAILVQLVTGKTIGTFGVPQWLDMILVPLVGIGFSMFVAITRNLERI